MHPYSSGEVDLDQSSQTFSVRAQRATNAFWSGMPRDAGGRWAPCLPPLRRNERCRRVRQASPAQSLGTLGLADFSCVCVCVCEPAASRSFAEPQGGKHVGAACRCEAPAGVDDNRMRYIRSCAAACIYYEMQGYLIRK